MQASKILRHELSLLRKGAGLPKTSLAIAALLTQWPAFANDQDSGLEEIIVTAQKRESSIQETPISITAVTGEMLKEMGISGVADLAREIPGVAVKSSGGTHKEIVIRGLSSQAGVSPTVGVYLDETPVSPPTISSIGKSAIDPDLYDLARVEILRGPQGTLYGASSMGGTLKLVPEQPKFNTFEGSVQVIGSSTQGGGANGKINAMLNVPLITDTVALRMVVTRGHDSGWIDRVVVNPFPVADPSATGSYFSAERPDLLSATPSKIYHDVNSSEVRGVRASLLVKPTAALTITPGVFYQDSQQNGADLYDAQPGTLAHYQPFDIAEPMYDQYRILSLKVEYDFGFATLTSASADIKRTVDYTQDSSEIIQKAFELPSTDAADGGAGPISTRERLPTKQFTQEVRLASNGDERTRWIIGGFYSRLRSTYNAAIGGPEAAAVLGDNNLYSSDYSDDLKQSALFGNLSYGFTDALRGTLGLRYFRSTDHFTSFDFGAIASNTYSSTDAKSNGVNPMANLAYTISPDAMVYGTVAKGFRDGGGNQPVSTDCNADLAAIGLSEAPRSYDPDSVWSGEIGSKNRLFDRNLTLNAAAYYQKWSQVQQTVKLKNCGWTYYDNAADAAVAGFEVEANLHLAAGLTLEQGIGYSHARFRNDNASTDVTKGDKLLGVPDWTTNTAVRYTRLLTSNLTFVGRANATYVGPIVAETSERITLPGYTLIGLRAGVQEDKWSLTAFVDNLSNHQAASWGTESTSIAVPGLDRIATNRPRTIGLDITYAF